MKSIFIAIALLLICSGCDSPAVNNGVPYQAASETEREKFNELSDKYAMQGWYQMLYSPNPDLDRAAESFNLCRRYNPDNYNAYWGLCVLRGLQAELIFADPENCLKESIELLTEAMQKNIPEEEVNNLKMDLANAYNGLGAYYSEKGADNSACDKRPPLSEAQNILKEIIAAEPGNGRAYYLAAVNAFYQDNIPLAREYASKAKELKFPVDPEFLEELK